MISHNTFFIPSKSACKNLPPKEDTLRCFCLEGNIFSLVHNFKNFIQVSQQYSLVIDGFWLNPLFERKRVRHPSKNILLIVSILVVVQLTSMDVWYFGYFLFVLYNNFSWNVLSEGILASHSNNIIIIIVNYSITIMYYFLLLLFRKLTTGCNNNKK